MLKKSKKILGIFLSLLVMFTFTSGYAMENYSGFSKVKKQDIKNVAVKVKPTPTIEKTTEKNDQIIYTIDIQGFVSGLYDKDEGIFIFKTKTETILLKGDTKILFEYIQKSITVRGNYIIGKSGSHGKKYFEVSEVFPDCLNGTVTSAIDLKKNIYELECNDQKVFINGASGLEKYIGSQVEVFGGYTRDKIKGKSIFGIHHYYPQVNEKFEGIITRVLDEEKDIYEMKNEKGCFAIVKNIPYESEDLGKFVGQNIFVAGLFVKDTVSGYPEHRVFEVLYFTGTSSNTPKNDPVSTPEPQKQDFSVHTVISQEPIYVKEINSHIGMNAKGNITISWKDDSNKAFFNAVVTGDNGSEYVFSLDSVEECSDDRIMGLFNVEKDGVLVASGIHGSVYGISQDKGEYFKFYSDGEGWHVSGYITSRYDY